MASGEIPRLGVVREEEEATLEPDPREKRPWRCDWGDGGGEGCRFPLQLLLSVLLLPSLEFRRMLDMNEVVKEVDGVAEPEEVVGCRYTNEESML